MPPKINISPDKLKRSKSVNPEDETPIAPSVSAGAIDRVIDLAFNPSREKIREMTIIDRMQARLLPLLDLINLQWQYSIDIASYRQDSIEYEKMHKKEKKPVCANLLEEYTYRLAQWQKSREGKNLDTATEIALAETEAKAGEDDFGKADDYYKD